MPDELVEVDQETQSSVHVLELVLDQAEALVAHIVQMAVKEFEYPMEMVDVYLDHLQSLVVEFLAAAAKYTDLYSWTLLGFV